MSIVQPRTLKQNKSLHLYFSQVANELNNHGISLKIALQDLEVDITEHNVKSMFKAIAKEKFGKSSTADLSRKELNECCEEMNRHISKLGIQVDFPSQENTENYLNSYIL